MKSNRLSLSRRTFIKKMSAGASAVYLSPFLNACSQSGKAYPLFSDTEIDVEIRLTAMRDAVQILSGYPTDVWRYKGELIRGPENTIEHIQDSYLGPILHLHQGQNIRIHFANQLGESSIIHWHGLHVPEAADGHPRLVISPGEEYIYEFSVLDRAGTYWFHPHPHGRTGPQVNNGLAGLIVIHDLEEAALDLPRRTYDLPLVIQDRTFDSNNQFIYGGTHMDQVMGFLGDTLLINGQLKKTYSVETRSYRLRLLNGSNSRIYKIAWSDKTKLTVIGTDGGLLEKPISKDYIILAPAQRTELWIDFSNRELGSVLSLINEESAMPGGENEFPIVNFSVDSQSGSSSELPQKLSKHVLNNPQEAVNATDPRQFVLQMGMGMSWNINGQSFEMEGVADDERIRLGDLEMWEFNNQAGGGMGMLLPHPMHIHGLQFQVISRNIDARYRELWETINDGLVDEGWHDTVLVMPGEQVQVLIRFEDFEGLYLYHCHNLEHEDMGMMRNYRVAA